MSPNRSGKDIRSNGITSLDFAGNGALMSMVPVIIVVKDQEQAVEWSCVSFLSSWRSVLLHGAILQEFEEASAFVSRGRFVGEVLQRDNQSNFEIYLIIATRTENEWSK